LANVEELDRRVQLSKRANRQNGDDGQHRRRIVEIAPASVTPHVQLMPESIICCDNFA
jgi:hypothetical protein